MFKLKQEKFKRDTTSTSQKKNIYCCTLGNPEVYFSSTNIIKDRDVHFSGIYKNYLAQIFQYF